MNLATFNKKSLSEYFTFFAKDYLAKTPSTVPWAKG